MNDCCSYLDAMLFVPVCTIDPGDMARTVLQYPSFGEVEELGGPGPSLDALYAEVSQSDSQTVSQSVSSVRRGDNRA